MARRKKVGVLTFHKCINYGSYWQARCLVEGLRGRGFDAELLDHDCDVVRLAEARCALQPKLPERTPRRELRDYAAKTRKFAQAISALPQSRPFPVHEPEAAGEYDAIVIGSDEVWNFRHPWYGSTPIFFGDGLKADRLVSYAASFGNHSAWDGISPEWAEKLRKFSEISVRDENSWHLIRNGTGREPEIVLDPVLQFASVVNVDSTSRDEPYALVYGHGFPDWLSQLARRWADARPMRLVSVGYSNPWADEQQVSAGPSEFAALVAGAEAVITNFFHGCVFALANGKPWAATPSEYRSIKIPDLANVLGASHRLIDEHTSDEAFGELLDMPIQPRVKERLADYRVRSDAYLDAALS
jgi:hypothetical protein